MYAILTLNEHGVAIRGTPYRYTQEEAARLSADLQVFAVIFGTGLRYVLEEKRFVCCWPKAPISRSPIPVASRR